MKRTTAENIVAFLSFSDDYHDGRQTIGQISPRHWGHVLPWLDDSGLSFYFLQKLKNRNATEVIPAPALRRLEKTFELNRLRADDMLLRFYSINERFEAAGVRYAVVKGFSLIPQFCPYAALRHMGDFDYLVDDQSVPAARQALTDAGYISKQSSSIMEEVFVVPGGRPSRNGEQYSPQAPHAVELHTDIWEADINRLPVMPKLFSVERAVIRRWNGLIFPVLSDQDAFLLQVLHACHHLFTLWIKMSSLFEIGYFLNGRNNDEEFWKAIEQRVGNNIILREFVVIITELVSKLFGSPVPPLIQSWGATIRPGSRIWIDNYGCRCVFSELPAYQFSLFPTAKFVVFLHEQFRDHASVGQDLIRKRLLPARRLSRMAASIKNHPSVAFNMAWWKHHLVIQRCIFHILAGLRYLCEVPRWRWLNRTKLRRASP
jgi:Uncharacterised nucleotidyltransferase